MLFQTLKTMLTTCTEPLTECLSPEDVQQMRESTEETQKKFLVKILDGKVTEEEANRCGGVKHKHKHKHKYKYKYKYKHKHKYKHKYKYKYSTLYLT